VKDIDPTAALTGRLAAQTRAWLERARPLFLQAGQVPPRVAVRFDLRGTNAGQMRQYPGGRLVIRYNLAIAERQPEAFLAETVPHEVAHVVAAVCHGRVRPHGPEWRAVMRWMGFRSPERCHRFETPAATRSQRRWAYRCECREHRLSTTRHNRARKGLAYVCRTCGTPLHYQGPAG